MSNLAIPLIFKLSRTKNSGVSQKSLIASIICSLSSLESMEASFIWRNFSLKDKPSISLTTLVLKSLRLPFIKARKLSQSAISFSFIPAVIINDVSSEEPMRRLSSYVIFFTTPFVQSFVSLIVPSKRKFLIKTF